MSVVEPIAKRSDPAIPQRRAANPQRSVWVSASAGTGKTKVLTDRVLSLLLAGTSPHRILCLTFTRAAAAEMAIRINRALAGWAIAGDEDLTKQLEALTGSTPDADTIRRARPLFAQVLDVPGGMKIQTIHSFCESLLGRFPLEAGIAPHFEVMDERDATEGQAEARLRTMDTYDEPYWRESSQTDNLTLSSGGSRLWYNRESHGLDNRLRYGQTFFIQKAERIHTTRPGQGARACPNPIRRARFASPSW